MNDLVTKEIEKISSLNGVEQFTAICDLHKDQDDDSLFPIKVAIELRNKAEFNLCDKILEIYRQFQEISVYATYELAVSRALQGDPRGSITSLHSIDTKKRSLKHWGLLSVQYARIGKYDKSLECFRAMTKGKPPNQEVLAMVDFCSYLNNYDCTAAELLFSDVDKVVISQTPQEVAESIISCIDSGRPYSLVRFGDGEGAWLSLDFGDEVQYQNLYRANRKEFVRNWFAKEQLVDNPAFVAHISQLDAALLNADHIGLPSLSWIRHEYKIASRRGISSLVNILRKLELLHKSGRSIPNGCNQMIHVDLLRYNLFDPILTNRKKVVVVSCHQELPALLSEKFSIKDVSLIKVPGSQQFKSVLGTDAAEGVHYPDRFTEICVLLEKIAPGTIALVGAGPLGKIYCNIVKRSGGIAIDIGSVADVWMKKVTRPFDKSIYDLSLAP